MSNGSHSTLVPATSSSWTISVPQKDSRCEKRSGGPEPSSSSYRPYSPDLNPIEQVFAKLKQLMRAAAARTIEATWKAAGNLLKRFQPDECRNYFVNAGYAST
jgi:hypothetical protein